MDQLTLDAAVSPQRKHRATDPDTSRRAALAAAPKAGSQRDRILRAIVAEPRGLTYEEAAERLGIKGVSASTRITELARGGWLEADGERGLATIWKATAKARGALCEASPPPRAENGSAACPEPLASQSATMQKPPWA